MRQAGRRRRRGQELVEYALILPIFLLVTLTILDLGRATYYASALHNAAREGARYGVINPDDFAAIEAIVRDRAIGLDQTDLTVTAIRPDDETIRVTVTYQFAIVTPIVGALVGSNEITLGSQATMRVEV